MADTATKLPIKTQAKPATAPAKPWAPFDTLRQEVDRLFDTVGRGFFPPAPRSVFDLDLTWPQDMSWAIAPAVDVVDKGQAYEITAELPGLDEKDIEVKLAEGTLTIRGEKQEDKEEKKKDYYVSERRYGSFVRSFQLPDGIETDKIEASFAKGVLTVSVPKAAQAQKSEKKIDVKAA
ncbi:MAG: Hsp20/alpha crystallin family protein [Devosia sp.]|nr:Hsp20/alpha crystallin family protein [Devosia sp.]